MQKNFLFYFLFIAAFLQKATAQDPEFSQFYANPLYLNPALAGTSARQENAAGRAVLNYRNQWDGLFKTFTAGWDQRFDKVHGGLGAQVITDVAGSGYYTTSEIRGFYSYHKTLGSGENQLYAGLMLAYGNRSIDFSKLKFGSQIQPGGFSDSSQPGMTNSITYPNAALGFAYSTSKYTAGVAFHNILEPNISFYHNPNGILPRRYTLHFGYHIQQEGMEFSAQPQLLFMKQASATQAVIGSAFNYKFVQAGVWWRQTFGQYNNADAAIFSLGYVGDHFKFLYSYDMTVSNARSAIPQSHEVSLAYRWTIKRKEHSNGRIIF